MRRQAPSGRHRKDLADAGPQTHGRPQGRPRVGRAALVLALSAAAAAVALTPFATAASKTPVPQPAVRLPATAEALAPYTPQDTCDPVAKPGVLAFRTLMLATYKRGTDGGIVRACDDGGVSEHKEGRAWDWMLDVHDAQDAAVASAVLQFLLAPGPHGEPAWNARRFGIMYIIWDAQIWGAYRAGDGWRPYTGTSEHTDHIHFSFSWAGAEKRTSWWTGTVAATDYGPCPPVGGGLAPVYRAPNLTPCPGMTGTADDPGTSTTPPPPARSARPYARLNDTGVHVRVVQAKLGVRPVTGFFGVRTLAAVQAYQRRVGLRATGVVDGWTAFRLGVGPNPSPAPPARSARPYARLNDTGAHVRVVQTKLGVKPVDGIFGARTLAAVQAYQRRLGLRATGVVDGWTAFRLGVGPSPLAKPASTPVTPATSPVYAKPGDTGARVQAVQTKLGVRPATGYYGTITTAAVRAYQARNHLPVTGVVDSTTATRLGLVRG